MPIMRIGKRLLALVVFLLTVMSLPHQQGQFLFLPALRAPAREPRLRCECGVRSAAATGVLFLLDFNPDVHSLASSAFSLKIHGIGGLTRGIAMFSAEEIQARLREKPFRPLRIVASEGLRFDIDHPDLVFVGRRDLMIGTPDPATPSIYDRVIRLALVHVVALEDLPSAPSTSHNGPPS